MDREQEEIQFLGFFGIFKESFKIIFTWRKIFSQITLALILPLSFIFLAHLQISHFLFREIRHDEIVLDRTPEGTTRYNKLSDHLTSDMIEYWLFRLAYFIFYLVLSLLSTAAVVYTIACIYTAKPITFKTVMSVVPRVWKRLMVTFLWSFVIIFLIHVFGLGVLFMWIQYLDGTPPGPYVLVILLILHIAVLVYISVIWHLASVISVLEDSYGLQAMIKGRNLIKGKQGIAVALFLLLFLGLVSIQIVFEIFVVLGWGLGLARWGIGFVCLLALLKLILFGLVIQTVIYFVCKSYHHEDINKSSLSDHLEVYLLQEYVPLKSKDVQLEEVHV